MRRAAPRIWHPEDIKAAIRKRGISLAKLALNAGFPRHVCQHALHEPNSHGEALIAGFLGIAAADIWPHRYNPDGTRRHQSRRAWKCTRRPDDRHRENQEAA
jgi:Ner family transcriptional regulator